MKKIGLLCLALVLALGALGVGYAAWTDQITINGTVNTGSLDINPVYFSGTEVWKDVENSTAVNYFWVKDEAGALVWENMTQPTAPDYFLVASAGASYAGDDTVTMTYTNLFPSTYLTADVIIHCDGTVPAIVTADISTTEPKLQWLWDNGYVSWSAAWVNVVPPPNWYFAYCAPITGPIQMHYCDYAKLWFSITLPQTGDKALEGSGYTADDFMNLKDLEFTGHFNAIQWNESGVPGEGNPCPPIVR
jgi:predicted ribosomally synthesized peptide with SipW-like signal peptide